MDKLIQHLEVWEKIFMALALIVSVSVMTVNLKEGTDYSWQVVSILWIVTCCLKTNKIKELENK
jgi:membrane protein YdbS with pleckstrin-like domain